jgi:hypothetical protein
VEVASLVPLGHGGAAVVLSWLYFRRYPVTRPPVGVLNLTDVAVMFAAVVLIPYLYLVLPVWLVAALLGLGVASVLYLTLEPVFARRWPIWPATLVLLGAEVAALLRFGAASAPFLAVNNLVLVLAIAGATNLWAQSGMRARDVAALAAALAVYDFVATAQTTLMADLMGRLAGLPFAPMVAWPAGEGRWVGLGLGDLLVAAVFPLVMRKAFTRAAGLAAMALGIGTIATLLALSLQGPFPVMVVLGPLLILQYLWWRRRLGPERTTWQYLQAEPVRVRQVAQP